MIDMYELAVNSKTTEEAMYKLAEQLNDQTLINLIDEMIKLMQTETNN